MARQRDYKAEYQRRLERGRARGVSRQIARGRHADEGGQLPDRSKASVISLQEINSGHLRVSTLETMHRMNRGLRGVDSARWQAAALRRGWAVVPLNSGVGFYTIDDIPREMIDALINRERQYFFGY